MLAVLVAWSLSLRARSLRRERVHGLMLEAPGADLHRARHRQQDLGRLGQSVAPFLAAGLGRR